MVTLDSLRKEREAKKKEARLAELSKLFLVRRLDDKESILTAAQIRACVYSK